MKKEKLNLYILIGSLALTVLFAILTIVYMIKSFNAFSVIALVIDVFAIGVIVYCFMQEKNENQPAEVAVSEAPVETKDEIEELFATEEVAEEVPVTEEAVEETAEEVAEEQLAADEAPAETIEE